MTISREEFFEHMDRLEANIKLHLDNKIEPISDKLSDMQRTLYGEDGRNGVVGDVNDMKTGVRFFKWMAATGLGSSVLHWAQKIIGH